MTARKTTPTPATATLAEYATKPLTPTIQDYVAWLKETTGYDVDPQSVALASALRGRFQKSDDNQARLAQAKTRKAEETVARAARRAEREAEAVERAAKKTARDAARIERARAIIAAAETKGQAA